MVILNSILSNIPVYFSPFYKALQAIIKDIIMFHGVFLCGGVEERKKTNWVSWEKVCLPKEEGRLGVKHCGLFNLAPLSKWKWRRIFNERNSF